MCSEPLDAALPRTARRLRRGSWLLAALLAACGGSTPLLVEAGCGKCLFDLPDADCALAVRIDGKALRVDGVDIDSLGDAHAADGLCNAVRRARATGAVRDGRFHAASLELMPADAAGPR